MTLPVEEHAAIDRTYDFLLDLLNRDKTPKVPLVIRRQALALLRHYPGKSRTEDLFFSAAMHDCDNAEDRRIKYGF